MFLSKSLALSPTRVLDSPFCFDNISPCITPDGSTKFQVPEKIAEQPPTLTCDLDIASTHSPNCLKLLSSSPNSDSRRSDTCLPTSHSGSTVHEVKKAVVGPSFQAIIRETTENVVESIFPADADINEALTSLEGNNSLEYLDSTLEDLQPSSEALLDEPLSIEEASIALELRSLRLKIPVSSNKGLPRATSLPAESIEAGGPSDTHFTLRRASSDPTDSRLVSALKGGRPRPLTLRVQWDPEVWDPPPTIASHTVGGSSAACNSRKRQQSDNKRKWGKKNQKTRSKGKTGGRL